MRKLLVLIISTLIYTNAIAQPNTDSLDVLRNVDMEQVVVTATRTPRQLKAVPIVTRVIGNMDIKRMDATNVGNLLESEMPGVEFTYAMNQQQQLNIQGFGGSSVLFLIDGERVAGETHDNVDYQRLNMSNVARIEIVKGAASSLYGSQAIGGVINILSQDATKPWAVNVNAKTGSIGEQRYNATISIRKDKIRSTMSAAREIAECIRLPREGVFEKIYANNVWNFKERLKYIPTDNITITARASYFFREMESSAVIFNRYRDFAGGIKGEWKIAEGQNAELSYSYDQYDKSDYTVASRLDIRDYSNVQHTIRGLYNYTFQGKHTFTIGGDYMRDYLLTYQFVNGGSFYQHMADAFAQLELTLPRDWQIVGGTRFDYYSDTKLKHVSSKVSFMKKLGNISLRGYYAGGFKAPSLKELYTSWNMQNMFMIYGNTHLRPEVSHNYSVSVEYQHQNANMLLNVFHNVVTDRISLIWSRAHNGMLYDNANKVDISGLDACVSTRWASGIGGKLAYTYTYESVLSGEPLVSSTRPHMVSLRVDYDKRWQKYGINTSLTGKILSATDAGEYTANTGFKEVETIHYSAYTMWKLLITQRIVNAISVTATIDNLFDYIPEYFHTSSPATIGRTYSIGLSVDIEELWK
ncbi:MAG: TonB-dependent receptor [Bacteroidales bacterium]|nr:TonB-dependent receptor [Bacteroidales bacterium]